MKLATGTAVYCRQPHQNHECNAHKLDLLMITLGKLKLWPFPPSPGTIYVKSATDLADTLKNIHFTSYYNIGHETGHPRCSMGELFVGINRILVDCNPGMLESQQRHLDEQSKK